jgi:hypothetical protein
MVENTKIGKGKDSEDDGKMQRCAGMIFRSNQAHRRTGENGVNPLPAGVVNGGAANYNLLINFGRRQWPEFIF